MFKLVIFDIDGTLIDSSPDIWTRLHEAFGTLEQNKENYELFKQGKFNFQEWSFNDIKSFNDSGKTKTDFMNVIKNLTLIPGAREVVDLLKNKGVPLGVVSGGLNLPLDYFFPERPFDELFVSKIYFDELGNITCWHAVPYDSDYKAEAVRELCLRTHISLDEVCFVGNDINDIEALKEAGLGIAFNPTNEDVALAADIVVYDDLRNILEHIL